MMHRYLIGPCRALAMAMLVAPCAALSAEANANAELLERIERLEYEVGVQKDIEEIRRLQFAYNYYNSNGYSKQLLDLIAEDAESIEIGGQGVYKGKKGFERNFSRYRADGKVADEARGFGRALVQLAGMDVITVAPDRQSAKARVRVLTPIFTDFPDSKFKFNGGDYEMGYIKEDGKWKISKFKYVHSFSAAFNKDGTITAGFSTRPDGAEDGPNTWYHPWPEVGPLPLHFENPVTGERTPELRNPKRYWIGNWPGEFGKTGHHDLSKQDE